MRVVRFYDRHYIAETLFPADESEDRYYFRYMKVIKGKEDIRTYASDIMTDEARTRFGTPRAVYYVETPEDIAQVVTAAREEGCGVTVAGAQTGITGGAAPAEDTSVISFARMNAIKRVEQDGKNNPVLVCQPGVTLRRIDDFLLDPSGHTNVEHGQAVQPGAWLYPPDPTEMSAQLGGTVATNASGARSFHYGATRRHIARVSMVLASGETITLCRGAHRCDNEGVMCARTDQGSQICVPRPSYTGPGIKNASGYFSSPDMDLLDLFIGSEGTLGIFCEIGIYLSPRHETVSGLSFVSDRETAFACADMLRANEETLAIEYFDVSALEFLDTYRSRLNVALAARPRGTRCALFWELRMDTASDQADNSAGDRSADRPDPYKKLRALEPKFDKCGAPFGHTWSGIEPHERRRLQEFRHAVPELVNTIIAQRKAQNSEIRKIGTDSAIPSSEFKDFFYKTLAMVEAREIERVIFGHLGDYHLHCNMIPASRDELSRALETYRDIMQEAVAHGGTVSAEHGIGKIKREYLQRMYGEMAISQMQRIKSILDPQGILNPGNLF